jgi:tetratricopeptide (TPR) repeat protein
VHAAEKAADAALRDYLQAIRLDPNDVNAHGLKGHLHCQSRDYKAALKEFNSALAIARVPSIIMNRGLCYVKMGRYKQAIADLDMFLSKKSGEAETYYARGQAYAGLGNTEFADDDFATACRRGYKPACRR